MKSKKRKPLLKQLINTLIAITILSLGYVCYMVVYDLRVRYINYSELNEISKLNKEYAARFEGFINTIEKETGWKVVIISGLRTRKEQDKLKRDNPQNAAVNKSRHVLGRAIDINLYKRGVLTILRLRKSSSNESWRKTGIAQIARRYRLLWGGTYKHYHDPVHFEIN